MAHHWSWRRGGLVFLQRLILGLLRRNSKEPSTQRCRLPSLLTCPTANYQPPLVVRAEQQLSFCKQKPNDFCSHRNCNVFQTQDSLDFWQSVLPCHTRSTCEVLASAHSASGAELELQLISDLLIAPDGWKLQQVTPRLARNACVGAVGVGHALREWCLRTLSLLALFPFVLIFPLRWRGWADLSLVTFLEAPCPPLHEGAGPWSDRRDLENCKIGLESWVWWRIAQLSHWAAGPFAWKHAARRVDWLSPRTVCQVQPMSWRTRPLRQRRSDWETHEHLEQPHQLDVVVGPSAEGGREDLYPWRKNGKIVAISSSVQRPHEQDQKCRGDSDQSVPWRSSAFRYN